GQLVVLACRANVSIGVGLAYNFRQGNPFKICFFTGITIVAISYVLGTPAIIVTNYKNGSAGQLSSFAVFGFTACSLARIFTTLSEVDDFLILIGYVLASVLYVVLAIQMVMYWNVEKGRGGEPKKLLFQAQVQVQALWSVASEQIAMCRVVESIQPVIASTLAEGETTPIFIDDVCCCYNLHFRAIEVAHKSDPSAKGIGEPFTVTAASGGGSAPAPKEQ
ncbi:17429_t:CDS:2, partial [Funneliformis caledonium]